MRRKKFTVKDMIMNLMKFNLDAEFKLVGNDGQPVLIDEFNIGWQSSSNFEERSIEFRDVALEKKTCYKVVLYPNNQKEDKS